MQRRRKLRCGLRIVGAPNIFPPVGVSFFLQPFAQPLYVHTPGTLGHHQPKALQSSPPPTPCTLVPSQARSCMQKFWGELCCFRAIIHMSYIPRDECRNVPECEFDLGVDGGGQPSSSGVEQPNSSGASIAAKSAMFAAPNSQNIKGGSVVSSPNSILAAIFQCLNPLQVPQWLASAILWDVMILNTGDQAFFSKRHNKVCRGAGAG